MGNSNNFENMKDVACDAQDSVYDNNFQGRENCSNCYTCNNSHSDEETGISEYIILIIAGVFLAGAIAGEYYQVFDSVVISALALISCAFTAIPIIYNAVKGFIDDRKSVCELAGLAIAGAILIGEYVVAAEVGLILTLGEIAEDYAYNRSRRDIKKIASLHPEFGFVKRDGVFAEIPVDEIVAGDTALVRPGDVVCADGVITHGETSVDESCLTGESLPVEKKEGSLIYSGSINLNGSVEIEVTRKGEDSTYSKIISLVNEAENRRPPSYPFIDKFTAVYTPLTLLVVAFTWFFTGSIENAITVIIVACPCGLLLSTPSAVISAIGAGARRGILFKSGVYLEEAGKIDTVLFDKTGTLTTGDLAVSEIQVFNGYLKEDLIEAGANAEFGMQHPVAKAVLKFAEDNGVKITGSDFLRHSEGNGVVAESGKRKFFAGTGKFIEKSGIKNTESMLDSAENLISKNLIPVFVANETEVIGIFGLEDLVRGESYDVVKTLRKSGINKICILTGDKREIAYKIADECGIDRENVFSGIMPADKKTITESFQKDGRNVCFIGDGVNDGPAIAQANIGVAVASRENTVAIETSHVVILKDDLKSLIMLLRIGRKAVKTININVAFALTITFLLVILAITGIIKPVSGALGHQVATLGVLINSALLSFGLDNNHHADKI